MKTNRTQICLRIPQTMLASIEELALEDERLRSDVLLRLITAGLRLRGKLPKETKQ